MKSLIKAMLAVSVLYSCKSETKNNMVDFPMKKTIPVGLLQKGCYGFSNENSSIRFQIVATSSTSIEANLYYALAEKDANNGSFKGSLTGDTLIGIYKFTSEGIESTREVAFLVKNQELLEGFGAMDSTGTKFKNIHTLQFSEDMPMSKIRCED